METTIITRTPRVHPISRLSSLAITKGWTYEPATVYSGVNPKAMTVRNIVRPTVISPDGKVRFAISGRDINFNEDDIVSYQRDSEWDPNKLTIIAIVTSGDCRLRNRATNAMKELCLMADELGIQMLLKPVVLKEFKDRRSLTPKKLIKWFKERGWTQVEEGDDTILQYFPQT